MAITVVATLRVRPGGEERFLKALGPLIEHVLHHEPDTLVYLYHQERTHRNEFLFYEVYADEAALQEHSASEAFQRFLSEVAPLLEGLPEIKMYEELGGKR